MSESSSAMTYEVCTKDGTWVDVPEWIYRNWGGAKRMEAKRMEAKR